MATVTIREAKAQLSNLIARVEAGEEIVITRDEEPVARLTPMEKAKPKRMPGLLKGKYDIPDAFFFDPLPEEELRLWEGEDEGSR
jgi:prevent-host-death family protein